MYKYMLATMLGLVLFVYGFVLGTWHQEDSLEPTQETVFIDASSKETYSSAISAVVASQPRQLYEVVRIVDGDTIDVSINGQIERLRLIGINTPETVDPRKPVECFGHKASNKAKELLAGKRVWLESDPAQGERDKYSRLLRYVFLEDGTNFNLAMIRDGYAYEYTYDEYYKYQTEFKTAQKYAEANKAGLWADETCGGETSVESIRDNPNSCDIKGNISSSKEKIYHVPDCGSYDKTVIDESAGERWFCSEGEALEAGWRKAKNC